ncbi:hypothetical protein GXP67_00095 [Rhodocytophaga rosea]|uniref:Uncharacterized protein n=1 Tax=Rhodocytophaga rosea TaxID=2704465 RepID=A0A6C0GB82_9BACT|nr:hypothetical protein [Rhodocytophaga rosea]QHT65186.1 hypothetical protein GXP67_00095 [Rhodocytophaga rosea]
MTSRLTIVWAVAMALSPMVTPYVYGSVIGDIFSFYFPIVTEFKNILQR